MVSLVILLSFSYLLLSKYSKFSLYIFSNVCALSLIYSSVHNISLGIGTIFGLYSYINLFSNFYGYP